MLARIKIEKNCTKLMIIVMIILFSHADIPAQNVWVREHEPARNLVTEERLAEYVAFLSDSLCQGRASGTVGNAGAAFWIHRQFAQCGLLRFSDTYAKRVYLGDGKAGHNIIGMLPGSSRKHCDSYIIVGAHYDHLGILDGKMYPGADSNASGVVAMISLARMISHMQKDGRTYGSNIIFVAFDAKEHSMAGSKAIWRLIENGSLKDPVSGKRISPDKIRFMVNIDQIGSSLVPVREHRKDYIIMLGNSSLDESQREVIESCNRFYSVNLDISHSYYGSENFTKVFYRLSDQRVFIDNGIPSVFFTSGITMNTNKTYDKASSLDYRTFKKRIYLMYHWIDKMI